MSRSTVFQRLLRQLRHQSHSNPYYSEQQRSISRRKVVLMIAATLTTGGIIFASGWALLERQRITEVRVEGLRYLDGAVVLAQIEQALQDRSFLGVQQRYRHNLKPDDIVRHMERESVEVLSVRREGSVLIVEINETVVQVAQQQEGGWALLSSDGQQLGTTSEAPPDIPRVVGPVQPGVIAFIMQANKILRRNNEARITQAVCDAESNGAWCSVVLKSKTILFNDTANANETLQVLRSLWQEPQTTIDTRFGQRIYLR